jgi:hypothetical protein
VIFSTLLTLYVVPSFYDQFARFTRSPGAIAAEIAAWERANPGVTAGEGHGRKAPSPAGE